MPWVLAISLALLAYIYAGYPVLIWMLSRVCGHPVKKGPFRGGVSVLIAAHNEAESLPGKLAGLLELARTEPIREIWIGLDGCTDGTGERVQEKISISNIQYPIFNDQGGSRKRGGEMETLPIREVVVHHEGLKSFLFDQTFDMEPGQFAMLWIPGMDEKPFSVSDVRDGMMEITVKEYGPFSRALMDCRVGEGVGVRGPFGRGFRPRGKGLIVGGGIGIAPLRMLAHWMEFNNMEFRAVLGGRTKNELIFADDFARMGAQFATDDGSFGEKGFALPLVEKLCAEESFDVIYGCGPEPMLVALKKLAEKVGCDCQLSMERHMKCGIGICGSCCVDGSGICICREGPVLDRAELDRVADFGMLHRDATGARKDK